MAGSGTAGEEGYEALRLRVEGGVARVVIDHPPLNLFDAVLIGEMDRAGRRLAGDPAVRVVVVESADPEFFVAHADVELIRRLPAPDPEAPAEPNVFHRMTERFRTMPKPVIAKIEGLCRGGGSEFALACDMRFAALGRAVLGQPEVALGILPGGGGTWRLPRLAGRGRALEALLGAGDFPAELAERYGWVNRALPAEAIGPFVDALAARIASFPPEAVAETKALVLEAEGDPEAHLAREARRFEALAASEEARGRMAAFLEGGGQTREGERALGLARGR